MNFLERKKRPFKRICQEDIYRIGAETRCLRRSDLITSLAESLPHGTVHLGCQILSVTQDSPTSYPIIQLQNGSVIKAKVSFRWP